jgi:hypothetical protein
MFGEFVLKQLLERMNQEARLWTITLWSMGECISFHTQFSSKANDLSKKRCIVIVVAATTTYPSICTAY